MKSDADSLIEEHVDLADHLTESFARRAPGIDVDAYRGLAYEALVVAARRFDPTTGTGFRAWAGQRIWWAILDEARRSSPNTRAQFKALRRGETFTRTGRGGVVREVAPVSLTSLDAPIGEATTLAETLGTNRDETATVDDMLDMRRRLRSVPARERFVLIARGLGYTQAEIGALLGVSHARVSQLQTRGAERMAA